LGRKEFEMKNLYVSVWDEIVEKERQIVEIAWIIVSKLKEDIGITEEDKKQVVTIPGGIYTKKLNERCRDLKWATGKLLDCEVELEFFELEMRKRRIISLRDLIDGDDIWNVAEIRFHSYIETTSDRVLEWRVRLSKKTEKKT
jgi:hypothetical protein